MKKEFYTMTIAGLKRNLPVCKLNDDLCIAAFVLFGDIELTVAAAAELIKLAPPHDIIITPEAKAIALAHEVARQEENMTYIVARKHVKLYMKEVFSVEVKSITTESKQTLHIDSLEADMMRGKRVLIVDDVISTGGSIYSMEKIVEEAGGIIAGKMAVLAEGDSKDREDIIYLEYLPLLDKNGDPI